MNPQLATATLPLLVAARLRPRVGSHLWLRVWAKRLLTLPALIVICARRAALRRAGANIGTLSVVNAKLIGPPAHLTVGAGSVICNGSIALHAPVTIGDNVVVNDGVEILTASHDLADPEWKMYRKPIVIDDYAWIAQGAMLLPGVRVGRGAVVGARAVVTRDVEPHTVVAGNPARPTSTRRVEELNYSPASFMSPYEAWLGTRTRSAQW